MEVQPVSAIRFPPRSSSYRAFSIIDAYGGDPGIQFSPVEEDIPTKEPYPTLLNSVRKLRTEDPLSGYYSFDVDETYGSSYGSDPERLTMTTMDEYDPYRQDLPVHTSRSKVGTPVPKAETPGEKVERSRADSGLAKGMSHLSSSRALSFIIRIALQSGHIQYLEDMAGKLKYIQLTAIITRHSEEARENPTIETQ